MFKNKGLAFKLSLYLLTVTFAVLFALLYYNYVISRNLVLKDAQNDAQKLTELTVARIENVLQGVESIPLSLASVIENRDTVRFIGTRKVIENVLVKNPLIYGACIAFAPGIKEKDTTYFAPYLYSSGDSIIFKDLASDEYRYTGKAWFIEARDKGKGVWSEPYYDEGGGEAMMATYSVPFFRRDGKDRVFAGVVTADISLTGLQSLINGIQFYDTGFGFLISSKGNIVIWGAFDNMDKRAVFNVFDEDNSPEMLQVLTKMTNGEKDIISLRGIATESNQNNWVSFDNVPAANWSLGIVFHENELYKGLDDLYIELIGIGLAGFLLIGFLIFIISRRFVKPIEKLAFATRKIGAGDFEFRIPSFKSQDEIAQLGRSFSAMQVELKEYVRNLQITTALKEKMESELQIAASIQQQMLPERKPIPGRETIDYYGVLKPARQIGGDLYDFIVSDDYLYFAIGDVAGKGIPAALFMAKTLTLFRARVGSGEEPQQIATEINSDLEQYNSQSMFVTFFIGKLNMKTGQLVYTNAGHNLPFVLKPGSAPRTMPGTHGLPPGSMPDVQYGHGVMKLEAETKLVLYTDGISEAVNTDNELFGEKRLSELLSEHGGRSVEDLGNHIMSEIVSFSDGAEQADDITLFILEYN